MTRLGLVARTTLLTLALTTALLAGPAGAGGIGWSAPDLGTPALGRVSGIDATACPTAGHCVALGATMSEIFAVTQRGRGWSAPVVVARGLYEPVVTSLACPAVGACSAGGYIATAAPVAFTLDEAGGHWGSLDQLAPVAGANGGGTSVTAVACAQAGSCVAIGQGGTPGETGGPVFVDVETAGTWGPESPVGTLVGDSGTPTAGVAAACVTDGPCTVAGEYSSNTLLDGNGGNMNEPFVDTETGGTWASPVALTGWPALNLATLPIFGGPDVSPWPTSLSCPAAGACVVVGAYGTNARPGLDGFSPFVDIESNGTWGTPTTIPPVDARNTSSYGTAEAVSCASATTCDVAGLYSSQHVYHSFIIPETAGRWGALTSIPWPPATLPGDTGHQRGSVFIQGLGCPRVGACAWWGSMTTQTETGQNLWPGEGVVIPPPGQAIVGTLIGGHLTFSRVVAPAGVGGTLFGDSLVGGACATRVLACATGGGWVYRATTPGTPTRLPVGYVRYFVLALG